MLGDDACRFSPLRVDRGDGCVLVDRRTRIARGVRDGAGRYAGLGVCIARREQRGSPVAGKLRHKFLDLGTIEDAGAQLEARRDLVAAGDTLLVGFGLRRQEDAARLEAGRVLPEALGLLDPEPVRFRGERHLRLMAALLPHETPGAARLLGGDRAALENRNLQSALREPPSRAAAHDAGADDCDVDGIEAVRRAHPHTPSNTRRKLPPSTLAASVSEKPRRRNAPGRAAKSSTIPKPCA